MGGATTIPSALLSAHAGNRMVVRLPADVAFDMGKMNRVIADLAERLGCPACLSGVDCSFKIERDFVVDPTSLKVRPLSSGGSGPKA